MNFVATKKGTGYENNLSPLSFVAVFRSEILDPKSGIRDPGWVKNQDVGSGVNIRIKSTRTRNPVEDGNQNANSI